MKNSIENVDFYKFQPNELEKLIEKAVNYAQIESNKCLKRMKHIKLQQKMAIKKQANFTQLVKDQNIFDDYLKYSFQSHHDMLTNFTNTLMSSLFQHIERLNKMIWDFYNIQMVLAENQKKSEVLFDNKQILDKLTIKKASKSNKLSNNNNNILIQNEYNSILKLIINYVETTEKSSQRNQAISINTQFKQIRDYYLIEDENQQLVYKNFSNLDYLFNMIEDSQDSSMKNIFILIPSIYIKFQSIYKQNVKNQRLKDFLIKREIKIPSNILSFVVFVQNKQYKEFTFSNFTYSFQPQKEIENNNAQSARYIENIVVPFYYSVIEFFFSNLNDHIHKVQVKTGNPLKKAKQISNKFECLLPYFTDKLKNTLFYINVFNKLIAPLMQYNSNYILYDLWDDSDQQKKPQHSYPFLEETFPIYQKQYKQCFRSIIQTFNEEAKEYHRQSDFIYDV